MCEGYVEKPLYLLIAEWMMAENRWVIAREISIHFDIEHSKAVNTLTYILSEVTEISCEVKMIPNKLEGRGCQCQRLVKVVDIDEQIYARLRNNSREKLVGVRKTPRIPAVPLTELNREQKWQMMLSKSMRRYCHFVDTVRADRRMRCWLNCTPNVGHNLTSEGAVYETFI